MLSTLNQHKSSVTTESARSIARKTTRSNNLMSMIPKHFYSVLSLSVAACMSIALTGCGGGNGSTTRTGTTIPPASTARTSYNLTVQSPVLLNNVKVTVTDTASGNVLGQAIINNSNSAVIAVPISYIKSGNVIMMTLSPVDSTSQYYDPMLNNELGAMASFNQSLHGLLSLGNADITAKVDPFTEIAYQRALVRTGTLDFTNPLISQLSTTQLTLANTELTEALGIGSTTPFTVLFNSPASIAALNVYTTSTLATVVNLQASYAVISLGQLALYAENNLSDPTPYLNFAARAALDMRDGDLDGMTTFGGDTAGTVQIANPILYTNVVSQVNSDPDNTNLTALISINANQRTQHGVVLKQATNQYFNTVNASLPAASRTDSASMNYIQTYDYASFDQTYSSLYPLSNSSLNTPNNRIGAGNYTLAFGLPTGTNFKNALDASDASGRSNDIMELNGVYQSTNGCQLSIAYNGTIQLSQGNQTFTGVVDRQFSDSLSRISGNQYLMDITSSNLTAPQFIQIWTTGAQITSADAGQSTQQNPTTLDTTAFSCTF